MPSVPKQKQNALDNFDAELLKMTYLSGGKVKKMFQKGVHGNKAELYTCRLCNQLCNHFNQNQSCTRNNIKQHLQSRKHQQNLEALNNDEFKVKTVKDSLNGGLPGMVKQEPNNNVAGSSSIFTSLALMHPDRQSVVGLEYIVEFLDGIKCFLCDKTFNERPPALHMASNVHMENYLQLHFKSVHNFITSMEQRVPELSAGNFVSQNHFKLWLLTEFSALIRKHCGVLQPRFIVEEIQKVDHRGISESIVGSQHLTEKDQGAKKVLEALTEDQVMTEILANLEKIFKITVKKEKSEEILILNSSDDTLIASDESLAASDESFTASDDTNIKDLTDGDYQVLLENFESLKSLEQQRLLAHIKTFSPKKFVNLRKLLSSEAGERLSKALKQP